MVTEEKLIRSFGNVRKDVMELQSSLTQIVGKQNEILRLMRDMKGKDSQLNKKIKTLDAKAKKLAKSGKTKVRTVTKTVTKRAKKTYVASKTGARVHERNCPFAKNIKPKMLLKFKSKTRAFNQGYKACECLKRV